MTTRRHELQQIKGIGSILAKRFEEAGLGSFAAIVAAGQTRLKAIQGINPRSIKSIIEQASLLQGDTKLTKEERLITVKSKCAELRDTIQTMAESARQRFSESIKSKPAEKLTASIVRLIDTIDKVEERAHKKVKRTGKAVAKTERRLEKLVEAKHKDLRNGFKKARKALRQALA